MLFDYALLVEREELRPMSMRHQDRKSVHRKICPRVELCHTCIKLIALTHKDLSTEIGKSLFPRLRDSPLGAGGESRNLGKRL